MSGLSARMAYLTPLTFHSRDDPEVVTLIQLPAPL
jgi:hypothetical protein